MSDKLISGIDDISGKPVIPSRDFLPEHKWRPPAERGGGLFQGGSKRKPTPAPTPTEAAPALDETSEFGDYVHALTTELHGRDRSSWRLGEIVAQFDIRLGARTEEERQAGKPSLNDLAREVGYSPQRLSEWRSCFDFWPESVRTLPKYSGFFWASWNEARRRAEIAAPDAEKHVCVGQAIALLNKALDLHLTNTDDFADWAKCMTWYPTEAWAMFQTLSWQHFSVGRKASGGYLENAYELLDKARQLNLSIEAFREYVARPKPTPGNPATPQAVVFETPDSLTFDSEWYGALKDLLPAGATAGKRYRITVEEIQ